MGMDKGNNGLRRGDMMKDQPSRQSPPVKTAQGRGRSRVFRH